MGPIWSREVSKMAGRALNKLSAVQAAKITKPGRHSDGGGLYLFIDKHRRRRWIFMYAKDGKRTELGLGSARDLSLANARIEATKLREVLVIGGDPKAERAKDDRIRSEEHTSELQSLMRNSYAVFCLKKKKHIVTNKPANDLPTQQTTDKHLQR